MKVNVVFLIVAFTAVSQEEIVSGNAKIREVLAEWKKAVEPFNTVCICKSGVSQALLDNLWERGELSSDPCFKCNLKCWGDEANVLSSTGVFDNKKLANLTYGLDTETVYKCAGIQGVDLCQRSYEIFRCFLQNLVSQSIPRFITEAWNAIVYLLNK